MFYLPSIMEPEELRRNGIATELWLCDSGLGCLQEERTMPSVTWANPAFY